MRELVSGKRKGSSPPTPEEARLGFRGWHERGYLPHCDKPGLTQFVTLHLADAFPAPLRSEWQALLQVENDQERRAQLEAYLDRGRGACHLRRTDVATLVEDAFRFHHPQWYDLLAWVVMPNHIHLLIKLGVTPLTKIVKESKRYTAREANRVLGQRGVSWAGDYWDTYMRDAEHTLRARRYAENNPVKACLVREPQAWPWSSARFRDGQGELRL